MLKCDSFFFRYNLELLTYKGSIKSALAQLIAERPQIKAGFLGHRIGDPHAGTIEKSEALLIVSLLHICSSLLACEQKHSSSHRLQIRMGVSKKPQSGGLGTGKYFEWVEGFPT